MGASRKLKRHRWRLCPRCHPRGAAGGRRARLHRSEQSAWHNAPLAGFGKPFLIRLIGIDVDGTLVGSSGVVAPAVWEAAARARERGIRLALCSGRPAFGLALDYARRLDASGWHIFQNGASILNLQSGESRSAALPTAAVHALIAQARRTGEVLELYNDRQYATETLTPWDRTHAELLGVPFESRSFDSLEAPLVRAQWLLSPERAAQRLSESAPGLEIAQSTSPLMPDVRFVGMTLHGVSKGSAIRAIAAAYEIDVQDVMYVGDAGNDLPALRLVGHPIAMANADPAVIAVAQRTVAHVDAGGLAQALELAHTL
jgi:Cof subfamily protein (haloacid dehalogenase superfamily)